MTMRSLSGGMTIYWVACSRRSDMGKQIRFVLAVAGCRFEGPGDFQQRQITPGFAHKLHADRQAALGEAARHADGRQTRHRDHAAHGHPVDVGGHGDAIDFAHPVQVSIEGRNLGSGQD